MIAGQRGVDVADARHYDLFFIANCAPLGIRDHVFHGGDRKALAHAGALVDLLVFARGKGYALDHFLHIVREMQGVTVAARPGFLRCDRDTFFDRRWIMRADLRSDAVFQRGNDFSARRVVFRVGAENQREVERQTNRISLNLHVTFLHDVEQSNLNLSGKVWKFIDSEDAAIGAGKQAIVNRQFARELVSTASRFDGVDVANQIGNGHIGRRQFLDIALVGSEIGDRGVVTEACDFIAATAADRRVRIVVNLASREVRHLRIEQGRQRAQDAAFRLSSQSEKNEIVARENGVDDLWDDCVVITDNAGKDGSVAVFPQMGYQIVAKFVFDAACT